MKKKRSPLFYLLLPVIQLLIDLGLMTLGPMLDSAIFSHSDETVGHGIPLFTVIFLLIAAVATVAVLIVSLVGLIRSLRRPRDAQAEQ